MCPHPPPPPAPPFRVFLDLARGRNVISQTACIYMFLESPPPPPPLLVKSLIRPRSNDYIQLLNFTIIHNLSVFLYGI